MSPRISGQSFADLPFEEEILEFLRFLRHITQIKTLIDVNINKLYQPWRSFAAVINKCLTGKSSGIESLRISQAQILRGLYHRSNRKKLLRLVNKRLQRVMKLLRVIGKVRMKRQENRKRRVLIQFLEPLKTMKMMIIMRRIKGWGLQVSQETQDTHVILTPTQSDAQQESSSTSSFMTNLLNPITDPDKVKSFEDNFSNISGIVNQYLHQQMPEAVREAVQTQTNRLQDSIQRENDEFLKTINENMKKIIKERVKTQVKAQVTRILPRIEEAVNAQLEAESDEEETRQEEEEEEEESFDPIPRTPEGSEDKGSDEEDQELRLSEERCRGGIHFHDGISPIVSLQPPTPIMTPSTIATITTSSDAPIPPTTIPSIILENLPTFNSAFRCDERLRSLETTFSEYRQTNPFVDAVSAIPADLSEMELKKILIEKIEGNKSIQRSDEQQNLYKALVEAYDA
nr:hypothetical protein [Tanacetum cinerariifolium]